MSVQPFQNDWTVVMVENLQISISEVLLSFVLITFSLAAEFVSFFLHSWADSLPITRDIIRTPYENFDSARSLGFTFKPNFVKLTNIPRIHYLDEGPSDSQKVIVLLHGEPFWSYCWLKIIPSLSQKARVIVPDFVGFGLSDKFKDWRMYNLKLHKQSLDGLLRHAGIDESSHNVHLVGHNWGWMVGAALARERPNLFQRLIILNTNNLPDGEANISRYSSISTLSKFMVINSFFLAFRSSINLLRGHFPLSLMMKSLNIQYTKKEVAALVSPWPSSEYCGGTTAFPLMVPVFASHPEAEEMTLIRNFLSTWQKPALIMYSDTSLLPWIDYGDFVVGTRLVFYKLLIPSVTRVLRIEGKAGHLVMYDEPEIIAREIESFLQL